MMIHARRARVVGGTAVALILSAALAACGGGGGSAAIGGTVTGLANGLTLVLQNNAADNFTITGNGATSFTFSFATPLGAGDAYAVTVLTQPLGETCLVANGTGNVNSSASAVTGIAITCGITSSVVGNLSGLKAGAFVSLSSGGAKAVDVTANGTFVFPGVLATGSTYTIAVTGQPAGQTCTVTNPTGIVVANTSAIVGVTCQ